MNTIKEESYQALFRRYYPRMFYYAKRIVGGQDDADDVVQEVFLELWNRMDSLDINEPTIESYLGSPDKSGGKFFNSI